MSIQISKIHVPKDFKDPGSAGRMIVVMGPPNGPYELITGLEVLETAKRNGLTSIDAKIEAPREQSPGTGLNNDSTSEPRS